MTPSKRNRKRDTETRREERVLVVSLLILYAVFVYSAFVKCDFCWGINYLFYFPAWIKLTFVILGGLCFFPGFNSIFHSAFSNLAQIIVIIYRYKKQNAVYRIIFYSVFVAAVVFVFYHFRIYSLYHAPMGAIYFMERNIPIGEYYRNWVLVEDKYSLLLLWAAARYFFKQILNFANYQSLATTSVLFGILFMLLLQFFISRLREYNPFEKLLIFVLIFTQGITYYYFGFANYYAPLPVVIFAYVVAVILYFRGEAGIYMPLFLGIFAVIVHLGAVFILPSMIFIVLHRFKNSFDFLYALATFRNYRKSLYALVSVIFLGYVLIAIGMPYSRALSEYFVPPFSVTERYGFPLFSMQYVIHLVNMLLLSSPVGIVLFIIYLNRIQKSEIFNDGKYALLWIAIAGVLHQVFLLPQTIFAWDVFAWTSIGYTVLGSFLLLHILKVIKNRSYYGTIVAAHCSIYFISWILLNSNPYAAVLNYLDTAQKYDQQLAWCLQILNEDPRDRIATRRLLIDLEDRAVSEEDYLGLADNYETIDDSVNWRRIYEKYLHLLQEAIRREPDNIYNYYEYIRTFSYEQRSDPRNRASMEPYYLKTIELEPDNINYLTLYGAFLVDTGDNEKAYPIFRKIDSLYTSNTVSLFDTPFPQAKSKLDLTWVSFTLHDNLETIRYFKEALALGAGFDDRNFENAITSCIISYAGMGNLGKGRELLAFAHDHNAAMNYDDAIVSKETAKGKEYGLSRLKDYLNAGNFMDLRKILEFMTENNPDPDFEIFWCPVYLWNEQYQELFIKASEILRHDRGYPYAHIFIGIGYLASQKNDSAMTAFDLETKMVPDSAYEEQALESTTIVQYLSQYVDDAQLSDSLKQSLRSVLSHVSH